MYPINSLSDAIRIIHYYIAEERGGEIVRQRSGMICWRDQSRGMIGPRRIWITEYAKDVYRLSGGHGGQFIKSVWPFEVPKQSRFELTMHASEITQEFVSELLPFVAASFDDFNEVPQITLYKTIEGYPSSAWTAKAEEVYNARPRRREAGE